MKPDVLITDNVIIQPHKLSLFTAILMTINIMVGAGVLIGPGQIAAIAGNASFLAWPLVGIIFLPIVLSIAQLTRMLPGAGGMYSYAKEGLNRTAGFLSGWVYIIGYSFAAAVEVLALRQAMLVAVGKHWFIDNALLFNGAMVIVCMILNSLSLKIFSKILNSLTIAKVLPLIILIALIPFVITSSFAVTAHELSFLPFSLPFAIFGYFGFEYACSISNLIEDSERNASRALLIGFVITMIIYTLFHFGLLNLMGSENLAHSGASAFAQFITLPIPYLKSLLSILIPVASVLALFAGANGMLNGNATILQAMGEEKLFTFWPWLIVLNRFNRPWVAIALQGTTIFLITICIPNLSIVGGLCNIGVFLSFVLPLISLIILQKRKGAYYKMPLAILALTIVIALIIYSWSSLGATVNERILYSSPVILAALGGFLILRRD